MKLTSTLVERAVAQFKAVPLPDTYATKKLEAIFGDHTFLLNDNGLHIIEPVDGGVEVGRVVKIADWQGPDQTTLAPHTPEPTDVVIRLAA